MKKFLLIGLLALLLSGFVGYKLSQPVESLYQPRYSSILPDDKGFVGAMEWKKQRTLGNELSVSPERLQEIKTSLTALSKTKSTSETEFTWTELGPDNVGGRTRALIYDKFNPSILYAGGVSGGLWKSTTGGQSWNKLSFSSLEEGEFATMNVSCLAQGADGAIYFGTGEGFGGSMSNYGVSQGAGIWKSADGVTFTQLEATWTGTNQNIFNYVNRMACDPDDANRVYAATHKGLYYSDDAGLSWNKIPSLSISTQSKECLDVKVGPDGTIVAAIDNKTYIAKEGDVNNMYRPLYSPAVNGGRLEFAIAPSTSAYMYCQAANSSGYLDSIYQSTDTGTTWTVIGPGGSLELQTVGNQGTYDNCIAAFPDNPEKIIVGGQAQMFMWTPQTLWQELTSGYVDPDSYLYVHADQHVFAFHPQYGQGGNQQVLVGTDGGIHLSNYGGLYWTMLNKNFAVTQFYKIDTDGQGRVAGGTQDNGTQYNDFGGNTIRNFVEINGGDGAETHLSELNPNVTFSTVYYGSLKRSEEKGSSIYETGRYFYNNFILNRFFGGLEGNIGDGSFPAAPFVTLFDLWESFYDENSIDSVTNLNSRYLVPEIEWNDFYQALQNTYSDFSLDTVSFININGEKMIDAGVIINSGSQMITGSSINNLPLVTVTNTTINPLDTFKVKDTYQAMLAIPLWDRANNNYNVWVTRKPLNFNILAPYQPWVPVMLGGISATSNWGMNDLAFSSDGNHLFIAFNSSLYRVSGFSTNRTVGQMHADSTATYGLTTTLIESFSNSINGIVIDPNDADNVLVTLSGYSGASSLYYSTNATAANPSFSSKMGNLPSMPVFTGIINVGDSKQALVGTEFGVFSTDDITVSSPTWKDQNINGMSHVFTADIVQQEFANYHYGQNNHYTIENSGMVYIGTHGRGIFRSDTWKGQVAVHGPIAETPVAANTMSVFPNPASESTTVRFSLNTGNHADIMVYDLHGKLVLSKQLSSLSPGEHSVTLNLKSLNAGSYLVVLKSGIVKRSQKIVVM